MGVVGEEVAWLQPSQRCDFCKHLYRIWRRDWKMLTSMKGKMEEQISRLVWKHNTWVREAGSIN